MSSESLSDRQAASSLQGKWFEHASEFVLKGKNHTILDTNAHPAPGYPSVDFITEDPEGQENWWEAKGSFSTNPGLERGDTIKKLVGVAADLLALRAERVSDNGYLIPYNVIGSHAPRPGTQDEAMLRRSIMRGEITQVYILDLTIWTP